VWEKEFTEELKQLFDEYAKMFDGGYPDEYEDIDYDAMTYDVFVGFIKESLRTGKEFPEVVP
jgi:hypothetical protein